MLIRTHSSETTQSEAVYSDCEAYRYSLTRRWEPNGAIVNFVMLNPSVADAEKNDPTVERCERRARQLGYAAFVVTNIFAWRDTDPHAMRKARHPVGPMNDKVLTETGQQADDVIAAWGAHGEHRDRGPEVEKLFRNLGVNLLHLGLSKHGHPRHPLYISYKIQPSPWMISTED